MVATDLYWSSAPDHQTLFVNVKVHTPLPATASDETEVKP